MKINNECIKEVLNYVIEKSEVVFNTTSSGYKGVSILSVIKELAEDSKYSESVVLHSCLYAYNFSLIITDKRIDLKNLIPAMIDILDVTPSGYKFLEENS
mgnify:CR=1 FL=1